MKKHFGRLIGILLMISLTGCADQPAPQEEPQSIPQIESTAPILTVGESVAIDGMCEFHVEHALITKDPDFYFEADTGRTCVDFCITYQHLADYTIHADRVMDGKLIYSGQYEYDGVAVACEEEGSPQSWSYAHTIQMKPSDTREVHYFFTVPEEVQDSGRMVELHMNIGGDDYRVIVREGEKGTVPGSESSTDKTSGAVTAGEWVTTGNAEFYVEYAEFSKKVTPPFPNSAYNYYAAEDGKILLDFCVAYKNLSGRKITAADAVSASLKQAEATAAAAELSERSSFDAPSLVNVIPLGTEYIHYIFQVPEELASNTEEVTVSFKIDGSRYTYAVKQKHGLRNK